MTAATPGRPDAGPSPTPARDWVRILSRYRVPDDRRSAFELAVTLGPFLGLWALAWAALAVSPWLAVAISVVNAGFLLRLFIIQHDCGHGAFFTSRRANDLTGRLLGVFTLTPYDVWRRNHAIHHSHAGNLEHRGTGDIRTLTLAEYRALGPAGRLGYRLYRNPLVMFVLGPIWLFGLTNRVPMGLWDAGPRYWASAMGTNLAILALLGAIWVAGGWMPILAIFVPSALVAGASGVWLFYVQHQFEEASWDHDPDWQIHDAALQGSSHYVLPGPLPWLSGHIGVHHVHHLQSRIPFYRLPEVLRDHPELAQIKRLTVGESLASARLHLWDEGSRRLLSFREARTVPA